MNGRVYYAYKSGRCIVNRTISGLRLGKNGYAVDTMQAHCKMAARRFIANHTTAGMTNRQKLRACFNYIIGYNRFVGSMDPTLLNSEAADGYTNTQFRCLKTV